VSQWLCFPELPILHFQQHSQAAFVHHVFRTIQRWHALP
jgi:hypothetical protein